MFGNSGLHVEQQFCWFTSLGNRIRIRIRNRICFMQGGQTMILLRKLTAFSITT